MTSRIQCSARQTACSQRFLVRQFADTGNFLWQSVFSCWQNLGTYRMLFEVSSNVTYAKARFCYFEKVCRHVRDELQRKTVSSFSIIRHNYDIIGEIDATSGRRDMQTAQDTPIGVRYPSAFLFAKIGCDIGLRAHRTISSVTARPITPAVSSSANT